MRKIGLIAAVVALAAVGAFVSTVGGDEVTDKVSQTESQSSTPSAEDTGQDSTESAKEILFFMNPRGRPCQMQDRVLNGMTEELEGRASVRRVKTTVQSDRQAFYTHGIRALPSMIVVDSDGKVIHRFTPGIHGEKTILDALKD